MELLGEVLATRQADELTIGEMEQYTRNGLAKQLAEYMVDRLPITKEQQENPHIWRYKTNVFALRESDVADIRLLLLDIKSLEPKAEHQIKRILDIIINGQWPASKITEVKK